MKIEKLRTNHIENPIGYFMENVSLSWVVTEAKGSRMEAARVEISRDAAFTDYVSDSGKQPGLDSLGYVPEIELSEGTRYYWRVSVWDDSGDTGVSDTAYFETAVTFTRAKWITAPFSQEVHPLFRRRFTLKDSVEKARLYVTGLGVYEAWLNGEKVGDEYLAPFHNDYNLWIQYQTYDVTESLHAGENAIGVMLGNGWYKGRFGFIDRMDKLYGDTFRLLLELHVTYAGGDTEIISTDGDWLCAASPVAESSIYDGEVWDSRKEIADWAGISCGELSFERAKETDGPTELLLPRLSLPVKIMEVLKPVELIRTNAGEQVLDFGQVMTGWVEFVCEEPKDTEVCFQFGEILQEGNFYNENLRTAKQEYRYISNGKKAYVRPHFTFYGFRYMKITGMTDIRLENFRGCVIYSEMEQTGRITTSNPKVNRLFENALWGQKGNFLDVPTDCPQRDERMGWTGDAQVFSATACYNMYTPAFYRKYLYDMKRLQDTMDGGVPHVVPDILGQIHRILSKDGKTSGNESVDSERNSCAWADAATIIPWTVYRTYGDKSMLAQQYGNMKDWTDCIRRIDVERCGGRYLWTDGFHFADWLALDNYHQGVSFGATDPYYVASVYYYYSASLTAKAAKVLGKDEDARYYGKLAEHVKEAIRKEYFTATGRLAADTQTGLVLALYFGLEPEATKGRIARDLLRKLEEENMHLTTGFVGTGFLCAALAENGLSEAAYTLLLNEDYPSWLYEVNMGATTIWERWNSVLPDGRISDTGMNSLNHYSYGAVAGWMYRYMCGVDVCEEAAGYRRFEIKPCVDGRFDWVKMEYESAKGHIGSAWKKTDAGYDFRIEIPFDTEADFALPMDCAQVRINGSVSGIKKKEERIHFTKGVYEIGIDCEPGV